MKVLGRCRGDPVGGKRTVEARPWARGRVASLDEWEGSGAVWSTFRASPSEWCGAIGFEAAAGADVCAATIDGRDRSRDRCNGGVNGVGALKHSSPEAFKARD